MTLQLTWTDKDINAVEKVLKHDYSDIKISTVNLTERFIQAVKGGCDIRSQYQAAVLHILHNPSEIIYFVREITKAYITISYAKVPEFKSLVHFYMSLVIVARSKC